MIETSSKEWFATWFDSPYYHQLYNHRDEAEAENFVTHLLDYLTTTHRLAPKSKLLDLACGKGRHSITMAKLGFDVLGVDLSPQSISCALHHSCASKTLAFDTHDMREVYPNKTFDAVFNLFTSFGYFESEADNEKMLKSIYKMLATNGLLVIDFFNAEKVVKNLVEHEVIERSTENYRINRSVTITHVHKSIRVEPKNGAAPADFREQVQLFYLEDFERLLTQANFNILATFGNFDLISFDSKTADRLIIIAQKVTPN
jgi:2-polyprenyl-3-methyl-5-hydroxy-6-metoxy-1,4-benzoquinol methylase